MIGAGGTTIFPDNYFFIDCSYILVCLRYGVIALLLLLIVYSLSCIKNKKDIYFLYAITLVSINCVIAHHILELEYNPFALALCIVNVSVLYQIIFHVQNSMFDKNKPYLGFHKYQSTAYFILSLFLLFSPASDTSPMLLS